MLTFADVEAASNRVVSEELFEVTITRDVQGGTLGIAVDLWDGEVTVGASGDGVTASQLWFAMLSPLTPMRFRGAVW